ncbi:hypothetical protein V6R21_16240 [Limibacter armeniacum]|uniref:hypothetical protein n=1 Tax=Limibacter armeniacum TaxID=466084 RepID=UPI002FE66778
MRIFLLIYLLFTPLVFFAQTMELDSSKIEIYNNVKTEELTVSQYVIEGDELKALGPIYDFSFLKGRVPGLFTIPSIIVVNDVPMTINEVPFEDIESIQVITGSHIFPMYENITGEEVIIRVTTTAQAKNGVTVSYRVRMTSEYLGDYIVGGNIIEPVLDKGYVKSLNHHLSLLSKSDSSLFQVSYNRNNSDYNIWDEKRHRDRVNLNYAQKLPSNLTLELGGVWSDQSLGLEDKESGQGIYWKAELKYQANEKFWTSIRTFGNNYNKYEKFTIPRHVEGFLRQDERSLEWQIGNQIEFEKFSISTSGIVGFKTQADLDQEDEKNNKPYALGVVETLINKRMLLKVVGAYEKNRNFEEANFDTPFSYSAQATYRLISKRNDVYKLFPYLTYSQVARMGDHFKNKNIEFGLNGKFLNDLIQLKGIYRKSKFNMFYDSEGLTSSLYQSPWNYKTIGVSLGAVVYKSGTWLCNANVNYSNGGSLQQPDNHSNDDDYSLQRTTVLYEKENPFTKMVSMVSTLSNGSFMFSIDVGTYEYLQAFDNYSVSQIRNVSVGYRLDDIIKGQGSIEGNIFARNIDLSGNDGKIYPFYGASIALRSR